LVYTYELPVGEWVQHALLLAPPPPPRPVTPAVVAKPATPPPARFQSTLEAPAAIPAGVALPQDDETSSLAGLSVPAPGGIPGGADGLDNGVFGVAGGMLAKISLPPKPLRVGGHVQAAKIVFRISPLYPAEAVEKGIDGLVRLEAVITAGGKIREINVLSGDPLLVASAVDAVRQWRYKPTYLNGQPVEVITQIEVNFKLTKPSETPATAAPKKESSGRRTRKR
jgi:protein TonB